MTPVAATSEFARAARVDVVRYAQVWEDHAVVAKALDLGPSDDVLAIASGGDNVLALLLAGPRSITAIDVSPAQTALCELKLASVLHLTYEDHLTLHGVGAGDPVAVYTRLAPRLRPPVRDYWNRRRPLLAGGLLHAGRLEQYFLAFQAEHLAAVHDAGTVADLFRPRPLAAQRRVFLETFATDELRRRFVAYFGRASMASRGRDPLQFLHVPEMDVGAYFWDRFCWAATSLPLCTNPYLEYFLTGGYRDLESGPPYLRRSAFERLKARAPRVRVLEADVASVLGGAEAGTFNKAYLSDVFEYMSEAEAAALFAALASSLRPGGRLVYFNLLVPRRRPEVLATRLRSRRAEAVALWQRDRSWFYRDFHVDEVCST